MKEQTFTSRNADAFGLDLEAETAFIFPQRSRDSWFHAGRRNLTCSVHGVLGWVAWSRRCSLDHV